MIAPQSAHTQTSNNEISPTKPSRWRQRKPHFKILFKKKKKKKKTHATQIVFIPVGRHINTSKTSQSHWNTCSSWTFTHWRILASRQLLNWILSVLFCFLFFEIDRTSESVFFFFWFFVFVSQESCWISLAAGIFLG